jgi:hypothetical protein
MKKLVGLSLFSIALLAASCQKEDLNKTRMESGTVSATPTWKKASAPSPESNSGSSSTGTGTGITDPNNDPDMNSKKGNKQ